MYKILADKHVIRALINLKKIEVINDSYFYDEMRVIEDETYLFVGQNTLREICRYYVLNEFSFAELSFLCDRYFNGRQSVRLEAIFQCKATMILKDNGFVFERIW